MAPTISVSAGPEVPVRTPYRSITPGDEARERAGAQLAQVHAKEGGETAVAVEDFAVAVDQDALEGAVRQLPETIGLKPVPCRDPIVDQRTGQAERQYGDRLRGDNDGDRRGCQVVRITRRDHPGVEGQDRGQRAEGEDGKRNGGQTGTDQPGKASVGIAALPNRISEQRGAKHHDDQHGGKIIGQGKGADQTGHAGEQHAGEAAGHQRADQQGVAGRSATELLDRASGRAAEHRQCQCRDDPSNRHGQAELGIGADQRRDECRPGNEGHENAE